MKAKKAKSGFLKPPKDGGTGVEEIDRGRPKREMGEELFCLRSRKLPGT